MKFSVITINYNNAEGLRRTIESVIAQTCHDYEYIIIDGNSNDGSQNVIEKYSQDIDYWVSEPDNGIYHAMNKGTRQAHGDYCIYMNSGDIFYSDDVLEKALKLNFSEAIVGGDLCLGPNVLQSPDEVTLKIFYKRSLLHQATFIKTCLVKKYPYDEQLRGASDWKFFMHRLIFDNVSYRHIPLVVALYETGGFTEKNGEISRSEVREELKRCFPKRVLDDYEDYCYGKSSYRKMMTKIEDVPVLCNLIYKINIIILKVLNLKMKAQWIEKL